MAKLHLMDCVRVVSDIPGLSQLPSLKAGTVGRITRSSQGSYDVAFGDDLDPYIATLKDDQLELVRSATEEVMTELFNSAQKQSSNE